MIDPAGIDALVASLLSVPRSPCSRQAKRQHMTAIALPRMPVFLDIVISPLTNDAAVRPPWPALPLFYTPKICLHARHTQYGYVNQVFPSIIHRLFAFTPFSAPESHQSNGMRAWNIHMPFSQSVERLPPICSISAANCLRPWPPGRLPECRAPISFTSVISKECVFTRTDTSYLPPEDA